MKAPTPSQWAALRTEAIGRAMGAKPLSSPAEFVVVEDQYVSAMRFSRSLDERNPYTRSALGYIASDEPPMHKGDLWVCIVGVAIFVGALIWRYAL